MNKFHCYIVPYFIDEKNNIQVLIGKKLAYSSKDGFIHNNPGQYVFIGGGCSKRKDKLIKSTFREFNEETGHKLNNYKSLHLKVFKEYSVVYYKVNKKYYNILKKINEKKVDKHKELKYVKWINLNYCLKLMDEDFKKNLSFGLKSKDDIHNYINDYINKKWVLTTELKKFKNYINKCMGSITNKQYNFILEDIKKNNIKSQYYNLLYNHLKKFIKGKSYVDWYYYMTVYLKTNLNKINKEIKDNKKKLRKDSLSDILKIKNLKIS